MHAPVVCAWIVGVATCFHHPGRETGRACTRCERPACPECLREAPVGAHCWECVKAARPPTTERLRRWNARTGPVVATVLVVVNIAVFLLDAIGGGLEVEARLALFGPAVAAGEWYRLVSTGFLHYGLFHLGFNMVLLYRFGEMLEPALGRARFVTLYLVALLSGSLGALLLHPSALTGGASGAVFGMVGAAALGQHRRGVGVWESGIGGLLAVNLVLTFLVPNISIGGHLGGLVGGALVGAVYFASPRSSRATVAGVAFGLALAAAVAAVAVWVAGQ